MEASEAISDVLIAPPLAITPPIPPLSPSSLLPSPSSSTAESMQVEGEASVEEAQVTAPLLSVTQVPLPLISPPSPSSSGPSSPLPLSQHSADPSTRPPSPPPHPPSLFPTPSIPSPFELLEPEAESTSAMEVEGAKTAEVTTETLPLVLPTSPSPSPSPLESLDELDSQPGAADVLTPEPLSPSLAAATPEDALPAPHPATPITVALSSDSQPLSPSTSTSITVIQRGKEEEGSELMVEAEAAHSAHEELYDTDPASELSLQSTQKQEEEEEVKETPLPSVDVAGPAPIEEPMDGPLEATAPVTDSIIDSSAAMETSTAAVGEVTEASPHPPVPSADPPATSAEAVAVEAEDASKTDVDVPVKDAVDALTASAVEDASMAAEAALASIAAQPAAPSASDEVPASQVEEDMEVETSALTLRPVIHSDADTDVDEDDEADDDVDISQHSTERTVDVPFTPTAEPALITPHTPSPLLTDDLHPAPTASADAVDATSPPFVPTSSAEQPPTAAELAVADSYLSQSQSSSAAPAVDEVPSSGAPEVAEGFLPTSQSLDVTPPTHVLPVTSLPATDVESQAGDERGREEEDEAEDDLDQSQSQASQSSMRTAVAAPTSARPTERPPSPIFGMTQQDDEDGLQGSDDEETADVASTPSSTAPPLLAVPAATGSQAEAELIARSSDEEAGVKPASADDDAQSQQLAHSQRSVISSSSADHDAFMLHEDEDADPEATPSTTPPLSSAMAIAPRPALNRGHDDEGDEDVAMDEEDEDDVHSASPRSPSISSPTRSVLRSRTPSPSFSQHDVDALHTHIAALQATVGERDIQLKRLTGEIACQKEVESALRDAQDEAMAERKAAFEQQQQVNFQLQMERADLQGQLLDAARDRLRREADARLERDALQSKVDSAAEEARLAQAELVTQRGQLQEARLQISKQVEAQQLTEQDLGGLRRLLEQREGELAQLTSTPLAHRVDALQQTAAAATKDRDEAMRKLSEAEAKLRQLKKDVKEQRKTLDKERELQDGRDRERTAAVQAMALQHNEVATRLSHSEESKRALSEQLKAAQAELKEQAVALRELTRLQVKEEVHLSELSQLKLTAANEATRAAQERKEAREELKASREEVRGLHDRLRASHVEAMQQKATMQAQVDEVKLLLTSSSEKAITQTERCAALKAQLDAAQKETKRATSDCERLRTASSDYERQRIAGALVEEKNRQLEKEYAELQRHTALVEQQRDVLKSDNEALHRQLHSLVAQQKAFHQPPHGPLDSFSRLGSSSAPANSPLSLAPPPVAPALPPSDEPAMKSRRLSSRDQPQDRVRPPPPTFNAALPTPTAVYDDALDAQATPVAPSAPAAPAEAQATNRVSPAPKAAPVELTGQSGQSGQSRRRSVLADPPVTEVKRRPSNPKPQGPQGDAAKENADNRPASVRGSTSARKMVADGPRPLEPRLKAAAAVPKAAEMEVEKAPATMWPILVVSGMPGTHDMGPLAAEVAKLGGFLYTATDDDIPSNVTHCAMVEAGRTYKSLVCGVRGACLVDVEWLHASLAAKRWLPETEYNGRRHSDVPFAGMTIAVHSSLSHSDDAYKLRIVRALVAICNGRVVDCDLNRLDSYHYILVKRAERIPDTRKGQVVNFDELMRKMEVYRDLKKLSNDRKRKQAEVTAEPPRSSTAASNDSGAAVNQTKRHKADPAPTAASTANAATAAASKSRRSLSKGLDALGLGQGQAAAIDITEEGAVEAMEDHRPTSLLTSHPEVASVPLAPRTPAASRSRSPPAAAASPVGSATASTGSAEGLRRSQREKPMTAEEKVAKEEEEALKKAVEESLQVQQKKAAEAEATAKAAKTPTPSATKPDSSAKPVSPKPATPPVEQLKTAAPLVVRAERDTAVEASSGGGEGKKAAGQKGGRPASDEAQVVEKKAPELNTRFQLKLAPQPPVELSASAESKADPSTPASKPRTRTFHAPLLTPTKVDVEEELKTAPRLTPAKQRQTLTSTRQAKTAVEEAEKGEEEEEVKEMAASQPPPSRAAAKGKRAAPGKGEAAKAGAREKGSEVEDEDEEEEVEELAQPQSAGKKGAKPQSGDSAAKRRRLRRGNGELA